MYNKKSKASAILAVITAVMLVGFMVLLPFLLYNTEIKGAGVLIIIFTLILGYLPLYASAIPYVIVASIFGGKMLKEQSRHKLISFNTRMLITACVLLPFLAWGLVSSSEVISQSSLGIFPIVYTVVMALAYVAALIAQIVTIVVLKKLPDEVDPA